MKLLFNLLQSLFIVCSFTYSDLAATKGLATENISTVVVPENNQQKNELKQEFKSDTKPVSLETNPEKKPGKAELEELSLEELLNQGIKEVPRNVEVTTSSRFAQSIASAPSLTYVVTDNDIKIYGYRNIGDILRSMPGLYLFKDTEFTYVGLSGLSQVGDLNSRLLYLIDGMRINENIYDAGLLDNDFYLDINLIDRVEYAPGSGSALYGNNAFLGVVNIITKKTHKLLGGQIHASAASDLERQLGFSLGYHFDESFNGALSVSRMTKKDIDVNWQIKEKNRKAFEQFNTDESEKVFAYIHAGGWDFRIANVERNRRFPLILNDGNKSLTQDNGKAENFFFQMTHERELSKNLDVYLGISKQRVKYTLLTPNIMEDQSLKYFSSAASGQWNNFDLRLSSRQFEQHTLMLGMEYQYDQIQKMTYALEGEEPFQELWGNNRRLGLFIQDEWKFSPTSQLVLGVRRDGELYGGKSTNPRLAWIWNGVEDASLKVIYGSAFRASNMNEWAVNLTRNTPEPTPEKIKTFEIAWDHRISPQDRYRISIRKSRIENMIIQGEQVLEYINADSIHAQELELGLEHRWENGAHLNLSTSFQNTKAGDTVKIGNYPHSLLKLNFNSPIINQNMHFGLQLIASSKRANEYQSLPGYVVANTNINWKVHRNADVSLGIYNLSNTHYSDSAEKHIFPMFQEGRSIRFAINWRFGQ